MKKILLAAALIAVSTSGLVAQTLATRNTGDLTTLGGWDFNGTTAASTTTLNARYNQQYGTYFTAGAGSNPGSAVYGAAYFSGSNGATFTNARGLQASGTGSPAPSGSYDLLSTVGLFGTNNSLGDQGTPTSNAKSVLLSSGTVLDNARATFKISSLTSILDPGVSLTTQAFADLSVAYSARNQGSSNAAISWSYSLDGMTFTDIASTSSTIAPSAAAYSVFSADFSAIDAIEGVSTIWLGLNYTETTAAASVFLDNIAIYGTALQAVTVAIPEPSTYAALLGAAVVGVSLLRRRKAALVA